MAAVRRAWCNTGPAFFRAFTPAACRPARAGPCCTTRTASFSVRACAWWWMHCSATLLARWIFTCARPKSHRPGGPEPTQSLAAHGDWPAAAARTRRGRSVQDGVVPPLAHAGLHAAVFNVVGSSAHSGSAATLADGLDDPKVCFRACNPGARVTARGRQCPFDVVRSGRSTGLWYRQASSGRFRDFDPANGRRPASAVPRKPVGGDAVLRLPVRPVVAVMHLYA